MRIGSLQNALSRQDYGDGEVIFEEGSTGTEIYFIVSGVIEISYMSGGEKKIMATLGKGEFFGEMAPLMDDVRSMTATAVEDVRLYELTPDEMLKYMKINPEIMRDMFASLLHRLKNTNIKLKKSNT